MSGPNPIIIDFIVRDLNKVLKGMKSIQDVVLGTEKKSTVAVKAGASERDQIRAKEKDLAVKTAVNTAGLLVAAQKAGAKGISKELATSLQNQRKHLQDIKKQEDAHVNYARKLREQHFNALHKGEQAAAKKSFGVKAEVQTKEAAHFNYQRQLRQQHFDRLDKAGQEASRKSDAQRRVEQRRAESDAQRRNDHAVDVAKRLASAEQKAHYDARRGGNADPKFSPQAQLALLRGVKKKSPEEQKHVLSKVAAMQQEAKLANAIRDKASKDEKRSQDKATKDFEKDQKKREVARKIAAREAKRDAEVLERRSERRREAFNRSAGNVIGGVGGIVKSATGAVLNSVTGLGGGFDVQTALQDKVNLDRQAHLLAIASRAPGQKPVTASQVLSTARAASIRTGTDQSDLVEGLNQFTAKTGNYDAGARNLDFFGKVAKTTGTNVKDVAATAGIMTVQNRELGKDALGEAALQKLILSSVMQARQGSVEFEDLARAGGKITRTSSAYAGSQDENQRKLLGLSQIGVRTGGKAEVAATDLSNLVSDSTTHKGEVEALLGRKFKDDRGRIVGGPDKFIGDLMEAAMAKKGGLDNLSNEGGDGKRVFGQRSMRFFQALAPVYNEAQKKALEDGASETDAKKAGAEAVRKDIATNIATNYTKEQMEAEFSEVMKSSAEKFEGAVRELKVGIADQLLPQLIQLIPVLKALTPVLVNLVAFLGKLTGTDIGARADSGAANMIAGANALGDLRTGKITPEQGKQIQAELGADTAKRETGSKDKVGRVFDSIMASFVDLGTLGIAGQTKKLSDERAAAAPSEKKAIEEQKALYDQLGKAIALATEELKKVKAPDGGGPGSGSPGTPPAPTTPLARRP